MKKALEAAKAAQTSAQNGQAEKAKALDVAQAEIEALKARAGEAEASKASLQASHEEVKKALEAAKAAAESGLAQKTDELKELTAKADWRHERIGVLEGELAELQKRYQQQQSEMKQNADLSLRLQSMTAADLSSLHERYAKLVAQKEMQDTLIAQLAGRLEQASDHLRLLSVADNPAIEVSDRKRK